MLHLSHNIYNAKVVQLCATTTDVGQLIIPRFHLPLKEKHTREQLLYSFWYLMRFSRYVILSPYMSCVKITKKIGTKQGPECAQHLAYKIIKGLLVFLTPLPNKFLDDRLKHAFFYRLHSLKQNKSFLNLRSFWLLDPFAVFFVLKNIITRRKRNENMTIDIMNRFFFFDNVP
jgi:hypothetical protein